MLKRHIKCYTWKLESETGGFGKCIHGRVGEFLRLRFVRHRDRGGSGGSRGTGVETRGRRRGRLH